MKRKECLNLLAHRVSEATMRPIGECRNFASLIIPTPDYDEYYQQIADSIENDFGFYLTKFNEFYN